MTRPKLFAVLAAVFVLALAGGVALAQTPPAVQPGTAHQNCSRITAAGYSPHDYIFRVTYDVVVEPTIDYTHSLFASDIEIYLRPVRRWINPSSGAVTLLDSPVYTVDYVSGGTVTDADGNSAASSNPAAPAIDDHPGFDVYLATRAGGTTVTFRDHEGGTYRFPKSDWVYDSNWTGPEGARMSSVWGSVPSCAG